MVDVYFQQTHYDDPGLRRIIFDMMIAMGADRITAGSSVVIKPNFLLAAGPDKGITTHPNIVRYVAEFIIDMGCQPLISDSPPMGSFEKILSKGGYIEALSGLGVIFRPFRESVKVDIGEPFGSVDIAKEAMEADLVVNLAKLKTHAQMLLTMGVKNIFGCVVGLKKPEWHFRAGADREMFARLLVQIYRAVNPTLNIIDGILALEGQGPGKSGTPRELNLLAGSQSGVALDAAICKLLGLEQEELLTGKIARQLELWPENIHVHGDFNILGDFDFPTIGSMALGPGFLHRFLRKYVLHKPVSNNRVCTLCGECWRYCPVKAIDHHIKGIRYNYDDCIRCYCCLEICPYGAITIKEPALGKIFRYKGRD